MIRTSRLPTILALAVAIAASLVWVTPTVAGAQHAAGLVIDTGERLVTVYVEFAEDTITGEELLQRADVDAVFSDEYGMGRAVCSILGVGSPRDDCFREAERSGHYWNYVRAEDGGWRRSNRGVSSTTVEHGDVDGWAWGPEGRQPPYRSFEEIRAEHAPPPSSPSPEEAQEDETAPAEPGPAADRTPAADEGPTEQLPAATEMPEDPTPGTPTPTPTATATTATPTATATTATPTPSGTAATPSPDPTPVTATEPVDRRRGPWSLLIFITVVGALLGAIVWRRRARSGTGQAPPRT